MSERAPRSGVSRREFVRLGAIGGAALVLGISGERVRLLSPHETRRKRASWAPSQWIRIDASGDVTITAASSEMGQGVRTAVPMIVAEELGAEWTRVRIVHARPGPEFTEMRTSGSSSVPDAWGPMRRVAAAAREMLVSAAAAEWGVDAASCAAERGHVVHRASGRRVEFGALVEAASKLPVPPSPILKPSSEYTLLGGRVARVDGPAIVRGTAVYGLDVRVPGMRVASIARCPQYGSGAKRWNEAAARAVPGVIGVVPIRTGIGVIATSTWAAFRGREALEVEWDIVPKPDDNSAAYLRALEAALPHGKVARREGGDVDAILKKAARTMEATYYSSFQAHAAIEPLNLVVQLRGDGSCELWSGTQCPNEVQADVAKLLGVPPARVVVNVPLLGGSFGRRLETSYVLEAVELARAMGGDAPVQVVWTREDDTRHDKYQPAQVNRLTAALDARGMPVAWRHRTADFNLTTFEEYDPNYDPVAGGNPWGAIDTPYDFPALEVTFAMVKAPVETGAWRSVSYPAAVFARESFLDEIAVATGRDPVALRLALIPSPGTVKRGSGTMPNGDRLRRVLQLAADRAGWGSPFTRDRADGRRWGRGIACNAYHGRTMVAQVAEVSVGAAGDVRVHRVVCAIDCGRVVNLAGVEQQVEGGVVWGLSAFLKGAITFADGACVQTGFLDFPVIRMGEEPVVETYVVPSELAPMGVGEQPVPVVWPAVGNAVTGAVQERRKGLPMQSGKLGSEGSRALASPAHSG